MTPSESYFCMRLKFHPASAGAISMLIWQGSMPSQVRNAIPGIWVPPSLPHGTLHITHTYSYDYSCMPGSRLAGNYS